MTTSKPTSSPFAARLFALQVSPHPEDAQELAFLEDFFEWKANDGPAKLEAKLNAQWLAEERKRNRPVLPVTKAEGRNLP